MKIVFVSNYINHHQIPISDRLYDLTNSDYFFIQTEPMEEERIKMGWDVNAISKLYVLLYYEDKCKCDELIMNADCVIFGGCEDEEIIIPRLEKNLFTLRYSERIYKSGRWKFVSPRGLKKKYHDHIRFNKSNVYMLCAGAYVKGDYNLIGAYRGKCLKYGYFPKTEIYDDINEYRRNNTSCNILWAGRFIDWKHPEMMLLLAKELLKRNIDFHITMIGNGPMYDEIVAKTTSDLLQNVIVFKSNQSPDEVRMEMRKSDIFISTSDRLEGWGAVINEAMNSGCVTVAAKEIGSAPYLIANGINGFTYHAGNVSKLTRIVSDSILNSEKSELIRINAYKTIIENWNAETVGRRLYDFILDTNRSVDKYKDGPLSKA